MNTTRRQVALLIAVAISNLTYAVQSYAQNSSPVSPRREVVQSVVQQAYDKFKTETKGKNADYIPYLAKVDSKLFGIALVTTDNQVMTLV